MEEALSWNQAAGHTFKTTKNEKHIFASKSLYGKPVPKPGQARSEFSAHKRDGARMCSSAVNGTASALLTPLTQFDRNDSQASCQFQLFADGGAAVNC